MRWKYNGGSWSNRVRKGIISSSNNYLVYRNARSVAVENIPSSVYDEKASDELVPSGVEQLVEDSE